MKRACERIMSHWSLQRTTGFPRSGQVSWMVTLRGRAEAHLSHPLDSMQRHWSSRTSTGHRWYWPVSCKSSEGHQEWVPCPPLSLSPGGFFTRTGAPVHSNLLSPGSLGVPALKTPSATERWGPFPGMWLAQRGGGFCGPLPHET